MSTAGKHLHQVAQHADDLDRAVDFYGNMLGLELLARFDPPGLAFFALGETRLLLQESAPSSLLYLTVDDVDASVRALRAAGVEIVADPQRIYRDDGGMFGPAGVEEWMAFIRDSEQNVVGLVERRAPD
jgi:methylmalonyl-CoA/ethylmalonyl-CoA epimerase